MKYLVPLLMIGLLLPIKSVKADHNAGGELSWICYSSGPDVGKFRFRLALYRFCEGISLGGNYTINSNSPAGNIPVSRVSVTDMSPPCYLGKEIDCYDVNKDGWAIDEHIYESAAINITGVPPPGGWEFYWSSCCRPAPAIYNWGYLVDNLHPQNQSYRIRAVMYPYNGQNTNPCYDNSPEFSEKPVTIICAGYPFTYNHNAIDVDLDSLTYEWTPALQSSGAPVTYATHLNTSQTVPRPDGGNFIVPSPGFSANVPMPWSHVNMNTNNVPATIDINTGEINFTSHTLGQYATSIKVSSYRCNIKIAEIMRDIPVLLLNCPPTASIPPLSNTPPQTEFRYCPACPAIPLPAKRSIYAGDSVEFWIYSNDPQLLPGFIGQTNYLLPSSSQFGTNYGATGCAYPPCATMDVTSTYYDPVNKYWKNQFGLNTKFAWKTNCNHIAAVNSCFTTSNTYNFVFKVLDDWCPAPGSNFLTFGITVLAPPALPAPSLKCSKVLPIGNVILDWDLPVSSVEDTLNSFRKYIIYRANAATGPYDTLHIVTDIDSITYTDVTANAHVAAKYYFIQGISSCNDQSVTSTSDTISSIRLIANVFNSGNSVALDWNFFNPGNRWGNSTIQRYYIWGIVGTDTTLLDSTTVNYDTLEVSYCFPTNADFMITVQDTTLGYGCTSVSTISGGAVGDNTAPFGLTLDSISYDLGGTIHMGWSSGTPDITKYFIYRGTTLIDSVPGNVTDFSYLPGTTDSCRLQFSIAAVDSCGNMGVAGAAQISMCSEIVDVIKCDTNKKIIVGWNIYNPGWAGGGGMQYIWRSENAGPFILLDSISGLLNEYADTNINSATTYTYRIRSTETASTRGSWTSQTSYYIDSLITGTIVGSPDLRCISYLDDNTIRLEWNKPLNPDLNFNKYMIYHSVTGTSFTLIDSITGIFTSDNLAWDSLGYTHTGINPSDEHFYYITTASGCDGQQESTPSTTLQAIRLIVNDVSDSVNLLEWNPLSAVPMFPQYAVLRDGNPWGTATFGSEVFTDIDQACNLDVQYQISYPDGTGRCVSQSRIVDAKFEDNTPPAKQFVDTVSFLSDSSFTAVVGWQNNTSQDVTKYYVVNCLSGSYSILDTIPATSPLFYTDVPNAPLATPTQYSVIAEDSCGNNNLASGNFNCHNTMFIELVMDFCDQSMVLNWNGYEDFSSGTSVEYRILASVAGGPFEEVGRTSETTFAYGNLINGEYYCFQIQAVENEGNGPFTSSSAYHCLEARFIQAPEFADMEFVTVQDSNKVRMSMKIDIGSDIEQYWVMRSTQRNDGYKVIATVDLPDPVTQADSNFFFEDGNAITTKQSYYYRVQVIDPCGELAIVSTHGRTIFLEVEADNEQNRNIVSWNPYELWEEGVESYQVWRGLGYASLRLVNTLKVNQFDILDNVQYSADRITYLDKVTDLSSSGNGEFCYKVVAIKKKGTGVNAEPKSSTSNIACTIQYPLFYVPSAFTPNDDGLNDYFKPYGTFVDAAGYRLEIYNRWGERIFETSDYSSPGWDGTHKGQPVPEDSYIFKVSYQSADGQSYSREGSLTINR